MLQALGRGGIGSSASVRAAYGWLASVSGAPICLASGAVWVWGVRYASNVESSSYTSPRRWRHPGEGVAA